MIHTGSARWTGNLKQGSGTLSSETGLLQNERYSLNSRIEGTPGTNPEELLGAAHAACFSMYFAGLLDRAGHAPEEVKTTAKVRLELVAGELTIPSVELDCRVQVKGLDEARVKELARKAKDECPVSRLFRGALVSVKVSQA